MADHWQQTFPWFATVHIPIPPAHGTERRAEVGSRRFEHGFTEGQASGLVPDQWSKYIQTFAQRYSTGRAERFLAAAKKNASMNFTGAIKTRKFIVQGASQQHPAESLRAGFAESRNVGQRATNGLNHGLR